MTTLAIPADEMKTIAETLRDSAEIAQKQAAFDAALRAEAPALFDMLVARGVLPATEKSAKLNAVLSDPTVLFGLFSKTAALVGPAPLGSGGERPGTPATGSTKEAESDRRYKAVLNGLE